MDKWKKRYEMKLMIGESGKQARHYLVKGLWQTTSEIASGDYRHISETTIKSRFKEGLSLDTPMNVQRSARMKGNSYSSKEGDDVSSCPFEFGAHIKLPVAGWGSVV